MIKKIVLFFILILGIFFIGSKFLPPKISPKTETKISETTTKITTALSQPKADQPMAEREVTKYLIKTAFVQQAPEKNWDEPWQDACEEASLLTVDYFYKNINSVTTEENRDAILKMIEFENTQNFTNDMTISQMVVVAQQYLNYQTKTIDNPTIEEIKKFISQDIPVIVTANGKILYEENKHFNSGGPYYHSLVILGFDDSKQQFTVHDVGTRSGAYFKYSYNLLMESIHDFPDSNKKEDINNGEKRVLILLK